MIAIIDYGVGNLFSISSSLRYLGFDIEIVKDEEKIKSADKIVLPGVGAFKDAMDKLTATGLVPAIKEQVANGKPMLGICLGMQLLFEDSYEYGHHNGLGLIKGSVCPLEDDLKAAGCNRLKVPQMGWNELEILKKDNPIMKYSNDGDFVYYVHSYYAKNCENSLVAVSDYGVKVPGTVANGNVFGCQFHPEKSGEAGLKILKAFGEM